MSDVKHVVLTTSATTSSSSWLQHITIDNGLQGNSGNSTITITHPTVGDNFHTTYVASGHVYKLPDGTVLHSLDDALL
jgi:hypothetical protein